ncbi:MAG: S8 family serine peptidase, partial [Chitinophagales bacterium]
GAGSKVAILDEGVDLSHPDLIDNLLTGYDAVYAGGGTGTDTYGGPIAGTNDAHGTNCAGIVCAVGNNALGITGVAPESKVIPVHIAYENGFGGWTLEYTWVSDAIMWACDVAGADVLSNSYSLGDDPAFIDDAIDYCITEARGGKGGVFLGAAGNYNAGTLIYPGSYINSIGVAATSMCDERKSPSSCDGETFWGSCFGLKLDIAAPGVKIPSTDISGSLGYSPNDYYLTFNGTSSATPLAAGIVALMFALAPDMTYDQARFYLESTCEKVGGYTYADAAGHPNGTWVNQLGYGRVNACAALNSIIDNFFKADLISGINTVSEDTVYPGQDVELNYFLENSGATGAGAFNHQFFVSTDCAPGGDEAADIFSVDALDAGASTLLTNTITIPETSSEGIRQILLYADEDDAVDESMEANNYSCIEVYVACSIGPESGSADYDYNGISDSLHVETTSACHWNFSPAPPAWITVTASAGTGDGYFKYTLDMNTEFIPRSYTFNYADKTFTINQGALQNGVEDISNVFQIYPNPVQDILTIHTELSGMDYMIYNSVGELVLTGNNIGIETTVDVHALSAGTYVITLQDNKGIYNSVFVKE